MAIINKTVLKLTFNTTGNKTFALSLDDPRPGLTANEIEAAMDTMIQRNIFLSPSGELTGKRDIRIVGTTIDDMFDPLQG
ncbi:Protein of unknown function (DUF2922) [Desulfitobacterium sp. LBE]|uniref:DUF2922 domain-containing protein n=1 Tax=bioreactor metagenome TaxID=1076179 RepID=A0A644TWU2_9ZZZZ|nr:MULTISPECIES: DUF2922 domain-containing protein [Desulfitobacterium]MEA5022062.1 DUF2922 domain-containing protein [Desulfitobacterium hafniense]TWH59274.1 Protein of unknown function (DUF2922) [Desulfitobacterium sp. LBE]